MTGTQDSISLTASTAVAGAPSVLPTDVTVGGGGTTLALMHSSVGSFTYAVSGMNKSLVGSGLSVLMGWHTKSGHADRKSGALLTASVSAGLYPGMKSQSTTDEAHSQHSSSAASLAAVPAASCQWQSLEQYGDTEFKKQTVTAHSVLSAAGVHDGPHGFGIGMPSSSTPRNSVKSDACMVGGNAKSANSVLNTGVSAMSSTSGKAPSASGSTGIAMSPSGYPSGVGSVTKNGLKTAKFVATSASASSVVKATQSSTVGQVVCSN